MALDFSKLNILKRLNARNRVFVLVGVVILLLVIIYVGTKMFSTEDKTIGPSRVANAPAGLKSVAGGENLSPEYYRTLRLSNEQLAKTAIEKGTSSVPTFIRVNEAPTQSCVVCTEESVNVNSLLDEWEKQGKVNPDVADELRQLAAHNVTSEEYANALDRLVKSGKLTPAQARELLALYKKQHANALLTDSAHLMDELIKSGALPLDVANELLEAQKKRMSPADYSALLDRLVREGKISPETAQRLLAQYSKQFAKEITMQSIAVLRQMSQAGQISAEIEKELVQLENQMGPIDGVSAALDRRVASGELIPAVAKKILDEYKMQKAAIGAIGTLEQMVQRAEAAAYQDIDDLVKSGQISKEVGDRLAGMIKADVPLDAFKAELDKMVRSGQISPEIAKRMLDQYAKIKNLRGLQNREAATGALKEIDDLVRQGKISPEVGARLKEMMQSNMPVDAFKAELDRMVKEGKLPPDVAKRMLEHYTKAKNLRDLMARLAALQGNNATRAQYADELRRAVQAGLITPEEAARLMQEYDSMLAAKNLSEIPLATGSDFAALQQRVQREATATAEATPEEFGETGAAATVQVDQERQARISALLSAMSSQAGQLVAAWQPPVMRHMEGSSQINEKEDRAKIKIGGKNAEGSSSEISKSSSGKPLIKAGTIIFGVLDTAVNSDYPNSPIMVTIVDGPFKGAKLLGKIQTTTGISGQMDRVSLNFTLMNMNSWTKSKSVTAYAIDPDDARTVLASHVNYHYLQRFGAMFATSFLQGYATAITTSSSTSTNNIFGTTSSTHPELSPAQKIGVALGQVGQTLGQATQNYVNRPPTVRVDSGVSLGILFMADVTS